MPRERKIKNRGVYDLITVNGVKPKATYSPSRLRFYFNIAASVVYNLEDYTHCLVSKRELGGMLLLPVVSEKTSIKECRFKLFDSGAQLTMQHTKLTIVLEGWFPEINNTFEKERVGFFVLPEHSDYKIGGTLKIILDESYTTKKRISNEYN